MAKRYYLVASLNELIDVYTDHRKGYDQVLKEMRDAEEKAVNTANKYNMTGHQRMVITAELNEKKTQLNKDIEMLRNSYIEKRDEILADIEDIFSYKYKVHPEMLDTATITALNAGVYTPTELIGLFEEFEKNNNLAMMRVVAAKAEEIAEEKNPINAADLKRLNAKLKSFKPEYEHITANVSELLNRSLGIRDPLSKYGGVSQQAHEMAAGYAKSLDRHIEPYLKQAEGIVETV